MDQGGTVRARGLWGRGWLEEETAVDRGVDGQVLEVTCAGD